jgi:hypothetical protein
LQLIAIPDTKYYEATNITDTANSCGTNVNMIYLMEAWVSRWKGEPYSIQLQEGAKPYHVPRPYNIPDAYEQAIKKETARLCEIGARKKVNHSGWATPCFITPKSNGTCRFISDLREASKRKNQQVSIPNSKNLRFANDTKGFPMGNSFFLF